MNDTLYQEIDIGFARHTGAGFKIYDGVGGLKKVLSVDLWGRWIYRN